MRQLQAKGAFEIFCNENYIGILGQSVTIYRRDDLSRVCSFNESRNNCCAAFINSHDFIVRNTEGVYRVYSAAQSTLLSTIKIKNMSRNEQDFQFCISKDNQYLLDVVKNSRRGFDFQRLSLNDGEVRTVTLTSDIRLFRFMHLGQDSDTVYFMSEVGVGIKDEILQAEKHYYRVDFRRMAVELVHHEISPAHPFTLLYFDNHKILNANGAITDAFTHETEKCIDIDLRCPPDRYIAKVRFLDDNQILAVVFNDRILLYDMFSMRNRFQYEARYCSCVEVIDGCIYLGTWERVMIDALVQAAPEIL